MKVIGAGLGRTGTASLQKALEVLLGGPCYHMLEVIERPEHVPVWRAAVHGHPPDWRSFFQEYRASVDWPGTPFWQSLGETFPDALILLSTRETPQAWWESAARTIFQSVDLPAEPNSPRQARYEMVKEMWSQTLTPDWRQPEPAMRAYQAHNQRVRELAPPDRLLEWQPGQGWDPLCRALNLPVPSQPFPHLNSSEEFRRQRGLE